MTPCRQALGSNSSTTQTPHQQALEISILYVFYSQMAVFRSLYFKTISVHLCNYLYLLLLHYNVMSIFNFLWICWISVHFQKRLLLK